MASAGCTTNCGNAPRFDPTGSSSFQDDSTPFQVKYGSGSVAGTLGHDTVQMAGFKVTAQTFGE